jgi:predicted DCC family thiol-disulfide oxidoreductase YuxK
MSSSSLTIYYNTRCPVCDAGIDWQRNKLLALVRAGTTEFRTSTSRPMCWRSLAPRSMMSGGLHATEEAGRLIVGADVAIARSG